MDSTTVNLVLNRVDALAAKLGITAEMMWDIWVKAAWTQLFVPVALLGVVGSIAILAWLAKKRADKLAVDSRYDAEPWNMLALVGLVISLFGLCVVVIELATALRYVLVPELYALNQFAKLFGK